MTLNELIAQLRYYLGTYDETVQTDAILTNFVRMGEELISSRLRVADMIQIDTATLTLDRVELPNDWQANDFVRLVDGRELTYKPRGEFYSMQNSTGWYTTSGLFLMVGGDPGPLNSKQLELHYFGDVPPVGVEGTWLSTRYSSVLLHAAMYFATGGTTDDERSSKYMDYVEKQTDTLNNNYRRSIGSGSRLNIRARSIG